MALNKLKSKYDNLGVAGLVLTVTRKLAPRESYRNYARLAEYDLKKRTCLAPD